MTKVTGSENHECIETGRRLRFDWLLFERLQVLVASKVLPIHRQ